MYITTCIHHNTQALHVLYYYSLVRDVHCNRTQYALRCLQLLVTVIIYLRERCVVVYTTQINAALEGW